MWQADGWGWRARLGVLTPHHDPVPEAELWAMAPPGVSISAARVPLGWVPAGASVAPKTGDEAARAFAEPPLVDDAAEMLAAGPIQVIVYAYTSSSYLLGAAAEAQLMARLEARTGGVPVVSPCAAAVLALRALGVSRLAVINPPWFSAELSRRGSDYFCSQQIDVVYAGSAELPGGRFDVQPEHVYKWVRAHVPVDAQAVFIGGNGFRAISTIKVLEAELGRPVLTANQVAFWHALRLTANGAPVEGYGQLFAHGVPGM